MAKKRASVLSNSATFHQLWDALGSRLIETAHEHQFCTLEVRGSSPLPPTLASTLPSAQQPGRKKGTSFNQKSPRWHTQQPSLGVSYQRREFEVMTPSDALVAYKTYARAEGKSAKTVSWVTSCVGYFADFLGPEGQDIASITGNELRRFIIALQEKHRYSHHRFNRPLETKLSPQTILTYCRGIELFFSFLAREGFIDANPVAKVKLPKVPQTVVS